MLGPNFCYFLRVLGPGFFYFLRVLGLSFCSLCLNYVFFWYYYDLVALGLGINFS